MLKRFQWVSLINFSFHMCHPLFHTLYSSRYFNWYGWAQKPLCHWDLPILFMAPSDNPQGHCNVALIHNYVCIFTLVTYQYRPRYLNRPRLVLQSLIYKTSFLLCYILFSMNLPWNSRKMGNRCPSPVIIKQNKTEIKGEENTFKIRKLWY